MAENRIRLVRQALGLTQQELAAKLGTSQSQVDRLEKGSRRLTIDWAQRVADALEVDISEVLPIKEGSPDPLASQIHWGAPDDRSMVPVKAALQGDADCVYLILEDVIGYVARPRGIPDGGVVFAFRTPSDLMAPRWKKGELVFVERTRRPGPGDYGLYLIDWIIGASTPVIFGEFYTGWSDTVEDDQGALSSETKLALRVYRRAMRISPDPVKEFDEEKALALWRVYDWPELIPV